MRIGLVAPPWIPVPPTKYGGIEAVVDALARGFADAGHEVVLAAAPSSSCPVERVAGLPELDPSRSGSCIDELRHSILVHRALADVDIVHDHTLAGPLYRHRPKRVPLVTTAHGPFEGGLRHAYLTMAIDTPIIAISEHQAQSAPAGTISRVIHHGLDTSAVRVGRGDGGYACFLGRMHPNKGLAEAIEIARTAGIPLRIGAKMTDRTEYDYFAAVIKPLLGPDIDYLGELNGSDKFELLGGAMALLNPIQWPEPFGMVMIESLAAGTPVLATPKGSVREIVRDGRTGFVRDSLAELATALTQVSALDRRDCRGDAEARFDAALMVRKHLAFYEELTSGLGPAAAATAAVSVEALPARGRRPLPPSERVS